MAEIRVRDASPSLLAALEKIKEDVKEVQLSTAIEKMIPRYWDMKKRIIEQNEEIGKLTRDLRLSQNRVADAGNDLTEYVLDLQNFQREALKHLQGIQKRTSSFLTGKKRPGTKKKSAARRPATRKRKIVPLKKKKK